MANSDSDNESIECAVCLQPSIHPVKLPCSHIFCFLCVKGVTIQSQRCPMCRREIPQSYLEHPTLVSHETSAKVNEACGEDTVTKHEEIRWFYQGRNGWWEYDERTAQELEHHHKKGDKTCELLIAGFLYVIDFEGMYQCRRNEPQRRRLIKRDLIVNVSDMKGIAGIRKQKNAENLVDDLADQVTNLSIQRPTLRSLVDLGAGSATIPITLNNYDNDDEDDDDNAAQQDDNFVLQL